MKISKHYEDNLKLLPKLTKKQLNEMYEIEKDTIAKFKGQIHELESAIGMMRIGHFFGWRVLYIIHNKRTIKKYESILNINIREYFQEVGPLAIRNKGFKIYEKLGNFWKIVSGDIKVANKKELE